MRIGRKRAGLLIETSNRQYSCIHFTFQEYLTATFVCKSGDADGMAVVWVAMRRVVTQSRRHEVLRLLISFLEQAES